MLGKFMLPPVRPQEVFLRLKTTVLDVFSLNPVEQTYRILNGLQFYAA